MNVAAPAADISSVRAVISEPKSLPLKTMSLSETIDFKIKSLPLISILPTCVPPAENLKSLPAESKTISPAESSVISPEERAIVVPSMLKLSMSMPASAVIFLRIQ